MKFNTLRLNKEEYEFVTTRYQDIDFSQLMSLKVGMSTLRNIDMLISSLDYDIEHRDFPVSEKEKAHCAALCRAIKEKALYYRDHNGKNRVDGFDPDLFCKRADEIASLAINEPIGSEIYKIDQSINYIRTIKDRLDEEKLFNVAIYLGTKLGELMLDDSLLQYGFDWMMEGFGKYPLIVEPGGISIDPIRFILDKLQHDNAVFDRNGTCSDFYYRFLDKVKG